MKADCASNPVKRTAPIFQRHLFWSLHEQEINSYCMWAFIHAEGLLVMTVSVTLANPEAASSWRY